MPPSSPAAPSPVARGEEGRTSSVAPSRPAGGVGARASRALRLRARLRQRYGLLVLLAPTLAIVGADLALRHDRIFDLSRVHAASYVLAVVESALLWGVLLGCAARSRGAYRWVASVLFVLFAGLALGGQFYFHRQYSTYLNLDATLWGTSVTESLLGQLRADGKNFLTSTVPPILAAVGLVGLARAVARPRARMARAMRGALPVAVIAVFLVPCSYRTVQASTPDVIYFHAIGGLVKQLTGLGEGMQVRPGLRTPPSLPASSPDHRLEPGRTVPRRNVVFVLTESVRADVACSAPTPDCPGTPFTNAALPGRLPLRQLRANSSTTAIELAVLWSGQEPVASREALHSAPLLFEYARAAGLESAYWTSHHMMFANSRLYVQDLPTRHQCGATDLDPLADIDLGASDELLTERVRRELGDLREPFLAVVHYGNTHVPYLVDPANAPFQPSVESKAPSDNEAYRNYYKNAVHRQDRTIADLVRFVRESPFGARTAIVYTSDHGEAFREHGQLGHTGSIFDEEIRVPGWIDAPVGVLADAEVAAVRAAADAPTFHTDVAPTVLDLLDLHDRPELSAFRSDLPGRSWLRPLGDPPTLLLTNCSGIWSCAFRNWGAMRGTKKLAAREWDTEFLCFDVLEDPAEQKDLGPAACGDLLDVATARFGGPPGRP